MTAIFTNNATSTLNGSITSGATTIAVAPADASKFPSPTAGQWFPVTVVDTALNLEIMRCTARTGASLTVVRAQEGTAARAFTSGDRVDHRLTAAAIADNVGAQGPQGIQGIQGPTGPTGPTGATGPAADTSMMVLKAGDTMTGTLVLPGGSAAATSLNFGTAGTGFYGAASVVNVAVGGVNKLIINPTLAAFAVPIGLPTTGSAAATTLNWGTPGTGIWSGGTSAIFAGIGGALKLTITAATITSAVPVALPGDPTNALEAAPKQYVDAAGAGKEPAISLGTTAQYWRGDKNWATLDKTAVGLANVDNTSDVSKPVSTAQAAAIATKEPVITAGTAADYWKGNKTWAVLDKAAVGLANVDNTSDASKPVSTATATALAGKEPTIAGGTTSQYWRGDKTWVNFPTGTAAVYIGDGPPGTPSIGQLWWESDTGNMFVYYDDGNTVQWVPANVPALPPMSVGSTAPSSPVVNQVWIDTT